MIAIAIMCAVVILTAVFVIGGKYQQELFEEYMEDSQSIDQRSPTESKLPSFGSP